MRFENRKPAVWGAGTNVINQGVSAWSFGLVEEQMQGCTVGNAANPRCVYPDVFTYTFNATLTYSCPSLLSLPHFYKASLSRLCLSPPPP